jgi:uridine kinase
MRSADLQCLAEKIRRLPTSAGSSRLVAIDGCGGAGKTTFALILASHLGNCPVVHTDDFASWDEPLNWWPRMIEQVFAPLSRGEPARYQRYDWTTRRLAEWHEVSGPVLIAEGVSATRREFRPYLAHRIWVDCPAGLRLRRGLERDGPEMEAQWCVWMADEDRYVIDHRPLDVADLIVDGSGLESPSENCR